MNKKELVTAVAGKSGLTKKDTDATLNAFIEVVKETLQSGERVQMIGFGTFNSVERAERTARNPQTGKPITIQAYKAPKFKAAPALKDAVNV